MSKKHESKLRIGIIGFGRFGTLVAAILSRRFEVSVVCHGVRPEHEQKAEKLGVRIASLADAASADIVILTVPISETERMIKQVAPLMRAGALLVDTCSVKVYPCEWLDKHVPENIEIMGTHPMFGPTTSKFDPDELKWQLAGLQIVLCPLRINKARLQKIKGYLADLKLEIITATPIDHDRQNAKTLSFVHFVGRSLLSAGIGPQKIFTPGYADLLKILPHTTSDNWQLFYDMQNYNPYADEVRDRFFDAMLGLEERISVSRGGDALTKLRLSINSYDRLIAKLFRRRFDITRLVGQLKLEQGLPLTDKKREAEIIRRAVKVAKLPEGFSKQLYALIFTEAKRQYRKLKK